MGMLLQGITAALLPCYGNISPAILRLSGNQATEKCLLFQGIRAALLRCYGSLSPTVFAQGCQQQPQAWPRLLFALAFFHALVLERRKYNPLGWNTKYDFSDGDFLCARQTLSMFLMTQVFPSLLLHPSDELIADGSRCITCA